MTDDPSVEDVAAAWRSACSALATCTDCRSHGLLHNDAKPLFGHFVPRRHGALFVFEAPNLPDTVDPAKGYLTYDLQTDETGKFTYELFAGVLGISPEEFQVTNAILCLPAGSKGDYPVRPAQAKMCSDKLRRQIEVLDPLVVVSVGGEALAALRRIDDHGFHGILSSVAQPRPWFGRWLFPLCHTSQKGRANRSKQKQVEDWSLLRDFLRKNKCNVSG